MGDRTWLFFEHAVLINSTSPSFCATTATWGRFSTEFCPVTMSLSIRSSLSKCLRITYRHIVFQNCPFVLQCVTLDSMYVPTWAIQYNKLLEELTYETCLLRQTILATKEKTLSWGKRPPRSAVFCKAKRILVEE